MDTSFVPITLRNAFFYDPFFQEFWLDFDKVHETSKQLKTTQICPWGVDFLREMKDMVEVERERQAVINQVKEVGEEIEVERERQNVLKEVKGVAEVEKQRQAIVNEVNAIGEVERERREVLKKIEDVVVEEVVKDVVMDIEEGAEVERERRNVVKEIREVAEVERERCQVARKIAQEAAALEGRKTLFPRAWMFPANMQSDLDNLGLFSSKEDKQLIRLREDKDGLEVSLCTAGYRPDEIKVSVVGKQLCVEGPRREESKDGARVNLNHFIRRFSMPREMKQGEVTSNLSQDGVLVVRAGNLQAIQ